MTRPASNSEAPDDPSDQVLDSIVNEFTRQVRSGLEPDVATFQQQYPHLKEQLSELLESVAMIENLKSTAANHAGSRNSFNRSFPMPETIGEYRILAEAGRGGMGVVYLAEHQTLGRRVAIKILPPSLAASEDRVDRFHREALAAAQLHHTNIVGVFGVGQHKDSFHFYVMDFVEGRGLDEVIADMGNPSEPGKHSRLTITGTSRYRWAARLGADLADALAYAHSQGVLHRDLKPANFLLGEDGVGRITDFGLAKQVDSEIHLTKTGDIIGTPQYLAPESLEGRYDTQSEVYCLGLTLYELIAAQPAFAPGSPAEVLGNITASRPKAIRKIAPNVPVDLATVIEKAIAREPANRYSDAAAFQRDLLAFSEGRAVSARRASTWQHVKRWARSNPLSTALSLLSLLLLVLVAVVTSIGYWSTSDALSKLQQQTERLHTQQTATAEALERAIENERRTAIEFARAEANVAITMEAFDEMFRQMVQGDGNTNAWDAQEFVELAGTDTGVTVADAEFLQKLLGFYREFAEQNADNVDLAAELARAYRRMGSIYQLIDQPKQAIEAYREAVSLYEWVSLANPDSDSARLAAFQVSTELSRLLDQVK